MFNRILNTPVINLFKFNDKNNSGVLSPKLLKFSKFLQLSCLQIERLLANLYIKFGVCETFLNNDIPVNIYLFKVNNRNTTKRCEISSNLTIKTYFTPFSSVSIVDWEQVNANRDYYFLSLLLLLIYFVLTYNRIQISVSMLKNSKI